MLREVGASRAQVLGSGVGFIMKRHCQEYNHSFFHGRNRALEIAAIKAEIFSNAETGYFPCKIFAIFQARIECRPFFSFPHKPQSHEWHDGMSFGSHMFRVS